MTQRPTRPTPDAPDSPWRTLRATEIYRNPWLTVTEFGVTRPDGSAGVYSVADPGDNVTIAAVDGEGRVLLVRDFIFPLQRWSWSLPGGAVEPEEDPLAAARRELAEEAELVAGDWLPLGSFWLTPGISPQTSLCFLARDLRAIAARSEPTEVISRVWTPLDDALDRCRHGEMRHATAALTLWLAREHLGGSGA